MKVAYVDFGFYTPSSVSTSLYEYSQALSKNGVDVTVFVRSNADNINSGPITIRPACKEYSIRKFTHIVFLFKLIKILKNESFDVVHIYYFPGVSLLPIFCKTRQRAWILEIQSGNTRNGLISRLYDLINEIEARSFKNILVLCDALARKLFGGVNLRKVTIIPLGTNIKRISGLKKIPGFWKKFGVLEKEKTLIYIGKLYRIRRIENVLKAIQLIGDSINGLSIKLIFIGGPEEDIERLKRKASKLQITDKLLFLNEVPYEDIPMYLVNSDIGLSYIVKSRAFNVQPPLKTLEYLAASLPVVATDTIGNSMLIKDGFNGILAGDSPYDYAHGLMELLKNENLQDKLRKNALDSVKQYDWVHISNRLHDLYTSLLR